MADPTSPDTSDVFYSRFNRIVSIVIWAAMLAVVCLVLFSPGGLQYWQLLIPPAIGALFAWLVLWRPHVRVDDEGVILANVTRSIRVPWAALIHVDTKHALTLHVPDHQYGAWAAPAPGRSTAYRAAKKQGSEYSGLVVNGTVRPGDLAHTDSGDAASLVRARWTALQDAGAIEPGLAQDTRVTITWHYATLACLVLGTAGMLLALGSR